MIRALFAAALLTAAAAVPACADETSFAPASTYNMATCSAFNLKSTADQDLAAAWVAGYISGANSVDPAEAHNAGKDWTHSGVRTWLRAWCQQHPLMSMAAAAVQLRANPAGAK
jgi:hypothetical protein